MQIIIVGSGEVGFALARALGRNHDVFVIDHDATAGDRLQSVDAEFVHGSGTSAAVLRRAQVERCDWLIACTGLDEANVVACSVAHQLGSPRTICFVSREDFLRLGDEAASLNEHFGINRVLWPEAQLADEILRIIAAPGAIDAEALASGEIRLLEYRLNCGACHAGDKNSVGHWVHRGHEVHGVLGSIGSGFLSVGGPGLPPSARSASAETP